MVTFSLCGVGSKVNKRVMPRIFGFNLFNRLYIGLWKAVYYDSNNVEYNSIYGKPNLRTHVDGDTNDLIINIQLDSNTVWDMGLNQKTYTLSDNSALVFNANKEIHWRVHKEFKEGEYVKMLFVRFCNPENMSDYSYLPHHPDDEMFKEAREFRDSLN